MTNATFRALKPEFIFSIFLFLASSAKVSEALFTMFHDAIAFIYFLQFYKIKMPFTFEFIVYIEFPEKSKYFLEVSFVSSQISSKLDFSVYLIN